MNSSTASTHLGTFLLFCAAFACAQPGTVDLTQLENYANQPVPSYIDKDNTPPDNAITDLGATLGRVLFYDKRLSRNNTVSCSSCHKQENAFSDPAIASIGVNGTTGRHSMRLINLRFADERRMFWDERAATAEAQASQPIQDHIEMGFSSTNGDPSFADLVTKLSAIVEYQVLFTAVYGDAAVTENRVQRSIAQFIRSIQSFDSKFDAGLLQTGNANANFPNYTATENLGKLLYLRDTRQGGAGCASCHRAPEFDIDPNSRNNGVIAQLGGGTDLTNTRAPSLRDLVNSNGVAHTPFMHNGVFANLGQVIAHYNTIPGNNQNLDQRLSGGRGGNGQRLGLTAAEQASLVAFLGTLTGEAVYTDPKWSDPFTAAGDLSMIVLPAQGLEIARASDSTARIQMAAVPNVSYELQVSGDLASWTSMGAMSSATGELDQLMDLSSIPTLQRRFYRFAFVPAP